MRVASVCDTPHGPDDGTIAPWATPATLPFDVETALSDLGFEVAGIATDSVIMHAGIGMRQLAVLLHGYPAQSDAIRLAARAYVQNQPVAPW